ncbi:MAG TPA: PIG-L family deacetylase [Gemmatimonadaceae bacterium]|nr:PIG-L family deacetylase [Gemmatimonadaceae bacterium]
MTLIIGRLLACGAGLLQMGVMSPARFEPLVRYTSNVPARHDVFVVAHEDDWQLFMGDVVAKRIRAGDSVIFIYLTAGDDGRDSLYWQTRERAALQSTRLAIGPDAADSAAVRCSTTEVLEHAIRKCMIANTESYFMRLPDGKRNGLGFGRHDYQSLRRLRGKKIGTMLAVDGSAAYHGWQDLMATANKLIGSSFAAAEIVVHANDPSIAANPHDHFDHRMAGLLVNDLRKGQTWDTRYYVGYALATRAANRSADEAREKTAIFLAYDKEMMRVNKAWSAYAEHPAFYSECMLRTYARKARASGNR